MRAPNTSAFPRRTFPSWRKSVRKAGNICRISTFTHPSGAFPTREVSAGVVANPDTAHDGIPSCGSHGHSAVSSRSRKRLRVASPDEFRTARRADDLPGPLRSIRPTPSSSEGSRRAEVLCEIRTPEYCSLPDLRRLRTVQRWRSLDENLCLPAGMGQKTRSDQGIRGVGNPLEPPACHRVPPHFSAQSDTQSWTQPPASPRGSRGSGSGRGDNPNAAPTLHASTTPYRPAIAKPPRIGTAASVMIMP